MCLKKNRIIFPILLSRLLWCLMTNVCKCTQQKNKLQTLCSWDVYLSKDSRFLESTDRVIPSLLILNLSKLDAPLIILGEMICTRFLHKMIIIKVYWNIFFCIPSTFSQIKCRKQNLWSSSFWSFTQPYQRLHFSFCYEGEWGWFWGGVIIKLLLMLLC